MYTPIVQPLGPDCQPVQCPKCNQNTVSKVKYVNGSYTWWSCIGILSFGCLIPFLISVKFCKMRLESILICYGVLLVLIGFPICFCSVYCHRCNKNRTTKLEFVTGKGSWSCCILLGIFGGLYGFIGIIALIDAIIQPETTEGSRASRIFSICIFLCLWFWICCCCMYISFYCDRFKDVEHYCSVHCPTCNQNTTTKLKYITGRNNWLWCFIIGMFGFSFCGYGFLFVSNAVDKGLNIAGPLAFSVISFCICCCCLPIPFYCDRCKNVEHYCSVCDTYIGKFSIITFTMFAMIKVGFRSSESPFLFLIPLAIGLIICCLALIPIYCDHCKDARHYCNVCNTYIGKYFHDAQRPVVYCPTCNQNTKTKLKFVTETHAGFVIALLGFIFCLMGILSFVASTIINIRKGLGIIDNKTGLIVLIVLVLSGLVICALSRIPLYCACFMDAEHYCSVCNTFIGKYIRDKRRPIVILPPESYKNLPIQQIIN
uniref:LITAF domain-containing protein n=1 Tax=Meloidogyne javanica TaxID=6303 RepID=A0A915M9F5_MELJA